MKKLITLIALCLIGIGAYGQKIANLDVSTPADVDSTARMLINVTPANSKLTSVTLGSMMGAYLDTYGVNAGTVYVEMADTALFFAPNIGMGNAGDTILFSYHDYLFGVKWDGSDTLAMTKVTGVVSTGADIDINLYTDVNYKDATPTQMLTSDLTITSTTTGDDATVFTDADVVPGEWLWIRVNQCTAQPTHCVINIYGYLK